MKKCQVIMLPNTGKAGLGSVFKVLCSSDDREDYLVVNQDPNITESNEVFKAQHLYVTSKEGLKDGDCVIVKNKDGLMLGKHYFCEDWGLHDFLYKGKTYPFSDTEYFVKVVASTDPELRLPGIPQRLIKAYVKSGIKEVSIEFKDNGGFSYAMYAGYADDIKSVSGTPHGRYMEFKGGSHDDIQNGGAVSVSVAPESGSSWDSVWNDFLASSEYDLCLARNLLPVFHKWVEENYYPPTKIEK